MKKLLGIILLGAFLLSSSLAQAATCFWVGGTGSIDDITHWSISTGGAGSTCLAAGGWPNSTADSGTFDASSGGGTITRNVAWTIGTLTTSAFTGTFGNAGDTATVNVNNFSNSGSGTRTVNLGASTWTCGSPGTTACTWGFTSATNLTFNANTSTVVMGGSTSGSYQIANLGPTGITYNVITFSPDQATGRGTLGSSSGTTNIATLNIGSPNEISNSNSNTWAVTTLNWTGGTPSLSSWVLMYSSAPGNQMTIALTNASSCTFCAFREINVTTSSITATDAINFGRNTNINFTPPSGGGGGGGRIIGG